MVCGGMAEVFLEVLMAKPLLVICGGGPVGQALAHHAAFCDFDILVVEDRKEFRRPELFPQGTQFCVVDRDYSGDFLKSYADLDLHITIVSRCWETDRAALVGIARQAPKNLRYLGLMGSRRKITRVIGELQGEGINLSSFDLQAPIGVPIGAETPSEIGISILAQIIQNRRAAGTDSLSSS
jgi:xanthine dehydrogenase accessory factor